MIIVRVAANLVRAVAYALTRALPKSHAVVLRGFPPYEDNIIAIYTALESRPINHITWIVEDPSLEPPVPLRNNTRLVKKGGLLDIYYSMTSRYLFLTHGYFLRSIPSNQVSINLWHGIPFKTIGRTMGMEGRYDSFLVATSDFTREAFAEAFGMPKNRIIVTGQARTDRMLNIDKQAVWNLAFPGMPRPRHVLLWLPTFRSTPFLGNRTDGEKFSNVFNCRDFSETVFNSLLEANDAVCLVKPHPMAARLDHFNSSKLFFIDESWLHRRQLSLYQLVGASDCLISDISSIIADFTLLDRPIVLLFEDIDCYRKNRGFTFNPITEFLPAAITRDFAGFIAEIEAILAGKDPYAVRRSELKRVFFDHADADAADRILDKVMGKSE